MKSKRIIALILSVLLAASSLVLAAGAAKKQGAAASSGEEDIINVMKLLDIMVGDQNGNMNLDSKLTRAQFVKMVIKASSYRDSVSTGTTFSPFPDVRANHWAASFVQTATSAGYIKGYLDGTFKPDNPVKLEEAATIALRLLGYTSSDLTGAYPTPQLSKFSELGLDTKVASSKGEHITRRDCMYIIYNLLSTKSKNGAVYCTTLGYSVGSDGILDIAALYKAESDGEFVYLGEGFDSRMTFKPEEASVYRDGKKAALSDIEKYDYIAFNNATKTIRCFSDNTIGVVTAVSGNTVTIGGKMSYSLGNSAVIYKFSSFGELAADDVVMLVFDEDGAVADAFEATAEMIYEYADDNDDTDLMGIIEGTIEGPVIVGSDDSWRKDIPLNLDDCDVSVTSDRNEKITVSGIASGDILYYSKPFNTLYIYRDTELGVISSVVNTSGMPSAVVLGQKTYTLGINSVKVKFYNGIFKEDDLVTLMLGRNGEVIDARAATAKDFAMYASDSAGYAEILNATLSEPIVVIEKEKWESLIPFELDGASLYRDNSVIEPEDVAVNSVVYYSEPLKSVWVYDDSITGTFESCEPSRVSPTSAVIAGNSYSIETSDAAYEFSALGSFKYGDTVTALIGRTGIVAVFDGSKTEIESNGIITAIGTKTYTRPSGATYSAKSITVTFSDATSATYEHSDLSLDEGDFVKVSIVGADVRIRAVKNNIGSSALYKINQLLADNAISENAEIIDVYRSKVMKVFPSRLAGKTLLAGDVIYYALDSDGNIDRLILDDVTGDMHSYMYLTEMVRKGTSGSYTGYQGGKLVTYGGYNFSNLEEDCGVAVKKDADGNVEKIVKLSEARVETSEMTKNSLYIGETEYEIANDAEIHIYDKSANKYVLATIDDIIDGAFTTVRVYYDGSPDYCGRVRVIMAR